MTWIPYELVIPWQPSFLARHFASARRGGDGGPPIQVHQISVTDC